MQDRDLDNVPSYRQTQPSFKQWLKYKFGGPGTLKKLGPTVSWRGPSERAYATNGCVGPGNARQQL